jgi:muramidase (phage lysozyme)
VSPNLAAFLATIRHSEGTDKYPDPYAVCFAGKFVITDFSDHPAVLGPWHGEPLDFLGPAYVGKVSTAAGAYQIIRPTWVALKHALGLHDFGPDAQDAAATRLIYDAGAIDLVNGGQVADAIARCSGIWASLPGSTSGQPQQKLADLISAYADKGGAFA